MAICFYILLLISSCTKDRLDKFTTNNFSNNPIQIEEGVLLINEVLAKAAGNEPDWIEMYNPNEVSLQLDSGRWYITDNLSNDTKSLLPQLTIPAKGFVLVICDGTLGIDANNHPHAAFSLSSAGEDAGIFYRDSTNTVIRIDGFAFPPQNIGGISYGRSPDGADVFVDFNSPTPGAPNY
jgi:hypothetical protein